METLDGSFEIEEKRKTQSEKNKLQVDTIFQSVLLGIALLTVVFEGLGLMIFYFGLGAYQLISSLIHLQYKNHSLGRKLYWPQLILHALTFLSLTVVKEPIDVLVVILFTTGFTAFYYYILTLVEYAGIRKHEYN